MSMYAEQAQQLVAEYEARRARTVELQRQMSEIQGTATGARGGIKATVNAQGSVTALEFPTGAYKRMAPKELSDALLTTINEAREQAIEAVRALLKPEISPGINFADMLKGRGDAVPSAPTLADIPQVIREYLGGGQPNRAEPDRRQA